HEKEGLMHIMSQHEGHFEAWLLWGYALAYKTEGIEALEDDLPRAGNERSCGSKIEERQDELRGGSWLAVVQLHAAVKNPGGISWLGERSPGLLITRLQPPEQDLRPHAVVSRGRNRKDHPEGPDRDRREDD